jgi:hypothetical protein
MNLRKEILALEIIVLMLYGFINIIGLKYNIKNDAVFCFVCFLFKKGWKNNPFTLGGWRNWNMDDILDKHVGDIDSAHNVAQERYNSYLTPVKQLIIKLWRWLVRRSGFIRFDWHIHLDHSGGMMKPNNPRTYGIFLSF